MSHVTIHTHKPLFVGIEGGGTRTTILAASTLADGSFHVEKEFTLGPCHVLFSEKELVAHFSAISDQLPGKPAFLGIGLAAVRAEEHRQKIRDAAEAVWPGSPVVAASDLETALAAGEADPQLAAHILVLSGTGSCCFGTARDGRSAKIGGRGHVMGDRASSVDIGRQALRGLAEEFDREGRWGILGRLVLQSLNMNNPEELIPWSLEVGKREIAGLAVAVFQAAARRDKLARRILDHAAHSLAADASACARRLVKPGQKLHFTFNGSVLVKNPAFAKQVRALIRRRLPKASAAALARPSVWGALVLAKGLAGSSPLNVTGDWKKRLFTNGSTSTSTSEPIPISKPKPKPKQKPKQKQKQKPSLVPAWLQDMAALAASPTEQRNPRSMKLSSLGLAAAVDLILNEDASLADAVRQEQRTIVRVTERIVSCIRAGGTLWYVGAGTSGRLGVLDASEIPPTFRTPPSWVQGIMAGGQRAIWSAVEGAEDDAWGGAEAARFRQVRAGDVVVGIAASGRTPFVWGFLSQAAEIGAFTTLLCFNPAVKALAGPATARRVPREIIAPNVGPEVLTGSTRMKCGTATKMILNILTTLAMTKLGKVESNLMVDLHPSNDKLKDRAVRILTNLRKMCREEAWSLLERAEWSIPAALRMVGKKA